MVDKVGPNDVSIQKVLIFNQSVQTAVSSFPDHEPRDYGLVHRFPSPCAPDHVTIVEVCGSRFDHDDGDGVCVAGDAVVGQGGDAGCHVKLLPGVKWEMSVMPAW